MTKTTIIFLVSMAAVAILATWIKSRRNIEVIERQSFGFFSETEASSKELGLFEGEYDVKPGEVRFGDSALLFRSAWIEKQAQWSYQWVWFFRPKPTSQRQIIIVAHRKGEGPDYFNLTLSKEGNGFALTGEYWVVKLENNGDTDEVAVECALGTRREIVRLLKRRPE